MTSTQFKQSHVYIKLGLYVQTVCDKRAHAQKTPSLLDELVLYLAHTCHSGVEHLSGGALGLLSALGEEHVDLIVLGVISFRQRRYPHKLGV